MRITLLKELTGLGWRRWTMIVLGVSLFASPWIIGVPAEDASSVNSYLVGISLAVVAGPLSIVASHVTVSLLGIVLAQWLLFSPFALGFAGSAAAWCAWTAGALALALTVSPEAVFDAAAWLQARRLRYGMRLISPRQIACYEEPAQPVCAQMLSRSIVERAHQIERAMRSSPSQTEAEMCIRGYHACVDDMITLARMTDKERPEARPVRRLRLRLYRNMAARSLSRARQVLPAEALRVARA